MTRVFVSIGSNIDRCRNVAGAVAMLRREFGDLVVSPVYETEAVGFVGEAFYNLVVAFDTNATIEFVIERLRRIERVHGRRGGEKRFESRTLDLDVLLFGDTIRHSGGIDVPRAELTRYAFALVPLCDIAPELVHPELGKTMARLLEELGDLEGLDQRDVAL